MPFKQLATALVPTIMHADARMFSLWLFFLVALVPISASADPVPIVSDLQRNAQDVRASGRVLVMLVSRSDCGYCKVLKREILEPLIASKEYAARVLFVELMIDDPRAIKDLDGTATTAGAIAQRYREALSPTLLFLNADGDELAKRRRGLTTIEFYGHYLDRAIRRAEAALAEKNS